MRILITGSDGRQVEAVGRMLAEQLGMRCSAVDDSISPNDIRRLDWCVVTVPVSIMLDPESRRLLRDRSIVMLLGADESEATEVLRPYSDIALDLYGYSPQDIIEKALVSIDAELSIRFQSPNTFGEIVRVTTFGESHGTAIGAVLDGIRPGTKISIDDIQHELDRRRPGQSIVTTSRREPDRIHVLSGVFEGRTTGAPIAMLIYNRDQDPQKYEELRDVFRPGHADFTYYAKYGIRDHMGGGRSSGRETAARVACGAVALNLLKERGVRVVAHALEIAGIRAERCDLSAIETNSVRCADTAAAAEMEAAVLKARASSDSVGGIVEIRIDGVPAGLGDPVFFKLGSRLAQAIMSIGAVKGIEIGHGFELARMRGSEANDTMRDGEFLSNRAGGISGGISTGQPIILRAAVKPTPSIARLQETTDVSGHNREIAIEGRHDPCIVPRIVPVMESMTALVILDAWEIQSRLRPDWQDRAE